MRHVALSFLVLFLGCGKDSGVGGGMDASMDDLSMPDLNTEDLQPAPDFAGVGCGTMTCDNSTQECCVMVSGTSVNAMCVAKGACDTDGGAVIQCDGPEDCPGLASSANAGCCVTLSGQAGNSDLGTMGSGSGASACTNSCVGTASSDGTNFTATTKLCHAKGDCGGYMGTLNFMGAPIPQSFDSCCQTPITGAYRFCFNGTTAAALMGANCTF